MIAFQQLQQQAYESLIKGNYTQAANGYEQAISAAPDVKSNYWYLGLVLLLQGQEVEAQTTWLMAMMEENPQVEEWTAQLNLVLVTEAMRREVLEEYAVAWAIRQQLREICPTEANNLLHLVELAIKLETYTGEELIDLGLLELFSELQVVPNWELLMSVLQRVLEYAPFHPTTLKFAEACLAFIHNQNQASQFVNILIPAAVDISFVNKQPGIAASLTELGLRLDAKNPELLRLLSSFYQYADEYEKGIDAAKLYYSLAESLTEKVTANHSLLRALMAASGYWEESRLVLQRQKLLLKELIELQPMSLDSVTVSRFLNTSFFLPYFQDSPQEFRQIQNQVAQLGYANIEVYAKALVERYRQGHGIRKQQQATDKRLRIGYVSHCFRNHSVGWLARSLVQHHDRDRFQVNGYFVVCDPAKYEPLHEWYIKQFSQVHKSRKIEETAEKIYQDEIDILIDMDSMTLDFSCQVMALKPAPIQATWLGWDASGMPSIDYFIADPYVLPDSAQEYYTEKIWRLPHAYIAVDGFEVGVPTLRRDDLGIESNAVVYFSGQTGYKRHPDTIRLQMQIVKEVPNSYFLIKGGAEEKSIKSLFTQLAQEVGVDRDRLRFLPLVQSEAVHRANLGIADVVLDTYPYNGATTTMEVLWMGIPLVTRVGEQFAARNSYTMMMNAGITEGIAWTDEDYVQWGIRFGKDEALRQQIAWKLRQSRHISPLWNAQQFTRDMENAYEQMWQRYVSAG